MACYRASRRSYLEDQRLLLHNAIARWDARKSRKHDTKDILPRLRTLSITAVSWGCREYTKLVVGTIMSMKLLKTMVGDHLLKAFFWAQER